jgi:hypothetical protein
MRITIDMGNLEWAEGKVPTPHGLISVRVEPDRVKLDSPVPVILELPGQPACELTPGEYEISIS